MSAAFSYHSCIPEKQLCRKRNIINSSFFLSLLFSLSFFLLLSSCEESRVFDKNISTTGDGWDYGDAKSFEVTIADLSSAYNMFINVRHTDQYPYNNIWIRVTTIYPDSTRKENRMNVQLTGPDGKWNGNCADGICYHSVPVQQGFKFDKQGKYTFILEQDMRINPLPYVMNVGLKIEKFM